MADIKTTLKVDGESKFEKDIKAAARSVKNLGENLKLSQEEFKRDGDQMKLVSERSKTLNAQIDQQEKIVKALAQAVKDSSEKYGEASTQTEKWQTELTKAQTTLTALQNELNNNAQGLDKNGKAFSDMADSAEDAKQKMTGIDFLAIDTAIGNVTDTAKNAAKAILNVGKSVWNMVSDSAHWADDLTTRANAASAVGVDRQTLQAWDYAAKIVDTDSDTIIDGINRILDRTTSGKESDLLMFNPLVKTTDEVTGKLRGAQDIFWDTIEALHNITDGNEQAARAQDIFGRNGFAKLMPLIKAGREEWQKYAKEAQDAGYVLSEDQLDSLGGFDDAIQRMETSAQSMRNTLSAELAPAMKTVADAITTITDKITEWANTEEGQKALESLGEAITSVVEALTKDVDFTALAESAAGVLTKIGDALTWTSTHPEIVLNGIKAAIGGYVGLKISSSVISLITALGGLKNLGAGTVNAVKSIMQQLGGGSGQAAGKAGDTAAKVATAAAGSRWPFGLLSAAVPIAVTAAAVAPAMMADAQNREQAKTDTLTTIARAEAAAQGLGEEADAFVQMITHAAQALGVGDKKDIFGQDVLSDPAKVHEALREAYQLNFSDVLDQNTQDQLTRFMEGLSGAGEGLSGQEEYSLLQSITSQLMGSLEQMQAAGTDAGKGAVDGLTGALDAGQETAKESAEGLADAVETGAKQRLKVNSPSLVFKSIGENVSIGLGNGIYAQSSYAISAARWLASQIEAATRNALDIHSPSGVAEELGEYYGLGFVSGIENSMDGIDAAFARMTNEALVMQAAPMPSPAPAAVSNGGDMAQLILNALSQARVQINGEDAGRLMLPTIEALMAEQVTSRRFA